MQIITEGTIKLPTGDIYKLDGTMFRNGFLLDSEQNGLYAVIDDDITIYKVEKTNDDLPKLMVSSVVMSKDWEIL